MDPLCGVLVPLGPHCDLVWTPVGLSLSETPEENPRSHPLSASMLPSELENQKLLEDGIESSNCSMI